MLAIFFIVLIPRLILIICFHGPLGTPMDEMSTLSTAAYAAGYDWTFMSKVSLHYYGGGFTILLAPLFKLINAPGLLYAAILAVFSVLQSLVAPIAYYICKHYLKIEKTLHLYLFSIIASYLVVTRSVYAINEHVLILATWVIALLLCKLYEYQECKVKKVLYTVLLFIQMSYVLTVHTRSQIYWMAFAVFFVLYWIFYKKCIVSVIPAIITGVAGYGLSKIFISWVQDSVWLANEGKQLMNTEVSLRVNADLLKQPVAWQSWASIVVGQVHTCIIFTAGFAAVAIVVVCYYYIRKTQQLIVAKKNKELQTENQKDVIYFILFTFFVLCIGGTIFAQSLRWLNTLTNAFKESPFESAYADKAITYIRYYGVYLGPFLVAAMGYCYQYHEKVKEALKAIITFFIIIQLVFIFFILPIISHTVVSSEVYWPFALHGLIGSRAITESIYRIGILACIFFFIIFIRLLYKQKWTAFSILFCGILVFSYFWNGAFWDGARMQRVSARVNAGYQLIRQLEKENDMPEVIYVRSTVEGGQHSSYVYQFMLKEYKIQINPTFKEDTILLCNNNTVERIADKGYIVYVLDDDEYVAVVSDKWQQAVEKLGYQKYQVQE